MSVRNLRLDLARPGAVAEAVRGASVVVDLVAASDPASSWRSAGREIEERVLSALIDALRTSTASVPLVVVASTVPPSPEAGHASDHLRAKLALEETLRDAARKGRLGSAALRLPTVYGLGAGGTGRGVVATMARRAAQGQAITVWRGADVRRNFLHVTDASGAFLRAVAEGRRDPGARCWAVGTTDTETVRGLADVVAEESAALGGPRVEIDEAPAPPWAVPADFADIWVDTAPFHRATGWQPTRDLRAGIREVVSHHLTENAERSNGCP